MLPSGFQQLSIRNKLLALVLVPLLVVLPLLGVVLLMWSDFAFDRLLITKIRSDLAVANGYFERVLGEVGASTAAIAEAHALHLALADPAPAAAAQRVALLLDAYRIRERLDFVRLLPVESNTDRPPGTTATQIQRGPRTRITVLDPGAQMVLETTLRSRVAVPLVPTRNAAPSARTIEDRALLLLSDHPVLDPAGRLLGHIQAGVLLNRNLPFIDHINQIVYPEGSLPFGSRGTATLFLDDVRISTNVRLFGDGRDQRDGRDSLDNRDNRAIGTRVSQAVRDTVLGAGQTWLDRAFVVNDWYVSGYLPLSDGVGQRVGMLYVGFTEAPFRWVKYGMLLAIGAMFFAVMIAAALVSLRWARSIFAPLERMALTMQQVGAGDLHARVGAVGAVGEVGRAGSHDEIGALAGHLDHLLDSIDTKTQELQSLNADLDAKVAQRTRDLEAAQDQLVRSEKLAAVGQLTAGVAHEVNNPIAVIQGNLDLMRELLGADAQRVGGELRLIDEQIERMRLIVTQLLQYARPNEYAGYVEPVDTARVLDDCLVLTGHLLQRTQIEIRRDSRATRLPAINRNELQQVFVNLIVNAIHAMPQGGTLTLATRDAGVDEVEIIVSDTGAGLAPELIDTLFQPFVTRKREGTGLGLWISRNLVERYGGDVLAANRSDGCSGAVFTVRLKVLATATD